MLIAHGLVKAMVVMVVSVVMVTMVVSLGSMVNDHGGEEFFHGAMVTFPMMV